MINLIKKDELNVQDEKEVYNAVLKWVKYDEEHRHQKMEPILSAVRCQFLPPQFLNDQMTNCEVIKKTPACKEYLARIFKVFLLFNISIFDSLLCCVSSSNVLSSGVPQSSHTDPILFNLFVNEVPGIA